MISTKFIASLPNIKKIKIGHPEPPSYLSLPPPPTHTHTPVKVDVICVSLLMTANLSRIEYFSNLFILLVFKKICK